MKKSLRIIHFNSFVCFVTKIDLWNFLFKFLVKDNISPTFSRKFTYSYYRAFKVNRFCPEPWFIFMLFTVCNMYTKSPHYLKLNVVIIHFALTVFQKQNEPNNKKENRKNERDLTYIRVQLLFQLTNWYNNGVGTYFLFCFFFVLSKRWN